MTSSNEHVVYPNVLIDVITNMFNKIGKTNSYKQVVLSIVLSATHHGCVTELHIHWCLWHTDHEFNTEEVDKLLQPRCANLWKNTAASLNS